MNNLDWLTEGLLHEIEECSPVATDIDGLQDNSRSGEVFAKACNRLFPQGRMFASHKQLDQVVRKFAEAWAFKTTHSGWVLKCHCAKANYKHKSSGSRNSSESLKESTQCPFATHYQLTDCH